MDNEARQQRGLVIAATTPIARVENQWLVPSQSSRTTLYAVVLDGEKPHCTCPDYELRGLPCKHIFAVEFVQKRETAPDGTVTETRAVRVTYAQNWPAYNAAQTSEKAEFCRLLHGLCAGIADPEQATGRPRFPLSDMLFAAAFKVYSTVSARRFMTDLRDATAAGMLAKAPHYNSIFRYLESEALTPLIQGLIADSSRPLAAVETDFAVDSTGFGTSQFFRYYSEKYGAKGRGERTERDWLKCHAMVGVKTNVVTSVAVLERNTSDALQFVPLVQATATRFAIAEVSADKAYSSRTNLSAVEALGGTPYIPFKINAVRDRTHEVWDRLFHFFSLNREEFGAHYHKRSNVEATFSAIKRVFGDAVRSRVRAAQVNEVLLKVLCHNIRCLVHAMHELGVDPALRPMVGAAAQ